MNEVWGTNGVASAQNHHNNCYFCVVSLSGRNRDKKNRGTILILNLQGEQFDIVVVFSFQFSPPCLILIQMMML